GSIAAAANVTITITATINAATPGGTTISNQGTIAYDSDGNGTNDASATTDNPATPAGNDATAFTVVVVQQGGPAVIPTLGPWSLALLALVTLGFGLALGRGRLARRD